MTDWPVCSVVTVVLNNACSLERTILSVVCKKDPRIEYIVVDGGSTDGTLQIIDMYSAVIDKVIVESDYGIYDAMNKGVRHATGKFIGMLNSGDYYESDVLPNLIGYMEEKQPDSVIYSDAYLAYSDSNIKRTLKGSSVDLIRRMSICHQAVFIGRSLYSRYGPYRLDLRYASDFSYLLTLRLNEERFFYFEKSVVTYSEGGASDKNIIRSRFENILVLYGLNSPRKLSGALLYIREIFLMIAYKSVKNIVGVNLAFKLRALLFFRKHS